MNGYIDIINYVVLMFARSANQWWPIINSLTFLKEEEMLLQKMRELPLFEHLSENEIW